MIRIHSLLMAESERTGMPTAYRRDLEYHDFRAIELRPGEPFLWSLFDGGTYLHFVRPDGPRSYATRERPQAIAETWPGALFYVFDGTALLPCRDAAHARELVEEVEKRFGANVDPYVC